MYNTALIHLGQHFNLRSMFLHCRFSIQLSFDGNHIFLANTDTMNQDWKWERKNLERVGKGSITMEGIGMGIGIRPFPKRDWGLKLKNGKGKNRD